MLQLLHIENIAVIERADISFRAGFNALTGETGAGKSIVIDSLGAVLGARTSRDLIRTGAAKAFVSAEFDGVDASLPVLAALGVEPEDGVLLLQRDIYADGKNICRANGRPITVAQLRALGTSLLNIHGQHEGTQLLDEEQHGAYLDRFARLDGLPEAYTERYQAARETRRQIEALEMDEAEKARRVDTLRHQIAELERAELRDGEEEQRRKVHGRLRRGGLRPLRRGRRPRRGEPAQERGERAPQCARPRRSLLRAVRAAGEPVFRRLRSRRNGARPEE